MIVNYKSLKRRYSEVFTYFISPNKFIDYYPQLLKNIHVIENNNKKSMNRTKQSNCKTNWL